MKVEGYEVIGLKGYMRKAYFIPVSIPKSKLIL